MRKFVLDYKLDDHGLRNLLTNHDTVEEHVFTEYVLAPSDGVQGKTHVRPRQMYQYLAK
jgi:hypothetical protein